jgi:hypothetical protein
MALLGEILSKLFLSLLADLSQRLDQWSHLLAPKSTYFVHGTDRT